MELYNLIFHSLRGKQKSKKYIFYIPTERRKSVIVNAVQFTNNHHNIAVNATLKPLPQRKIYSKSKTILQYSNKEKVPENP